MRALQLAPKRIGTTIQTTSFRFDVFGTERLILRLRNKARRIARMRTVGVDRVGKYLYEKKRLDCKMGLYSGQEVAPNKWRFGWEYLGGPAIYHFTKATLNAHELGKRYSGMIDRIEVRLNLAKAPHAGKIHGRMKSGETSSDLFYSSHLKKLVKTRPWMKAKPEERVEAVKILRKTYMGN